MAYENDWVTHEIPDPATEGLRFLKLSYNLTVNWTGNGSNEITVSTDIPEAFKRSDHLWIYSGMSYRQVAMVINTEIPQCPYQCRMTFDSAANDLLETLNFIAPQFYIYRASGASRLAAFTPANVDSALYAESAKNTALADDRKYLSTPYNYACEPRVTFNFGDSSSGGEMIHHSFPDEPGTTVVNIEIIFAFTAEQNERYNDLLSRYPDHVTPFQYIVTDIPYRLDFPELIESIDIADLWVADVLSYTREWTNISSDWSFSFDGQDVWTDGNDIYISCAGRSADYVLNKGTLLWETKSWTWEGGRPSPFGGRNIWTDGTDMYYSYGTTQYILNKSENKWYKKTWTGNLTGFYGGSVWTDGANVYYSMGDQQYVFDKANSTWDVKTWNGMTNFYGAYIWSDGTNIYYSKIDQSSGQRVLNKATSTWETVTWYRSTGSTFNPNGQYIWTDGTDMYYSSSFDHYVLNKSDMKWYTKTWTGLSYISSGAYIWNYGEHVYYSYSSTQYELKKNAVTSVPYRLRFPALIESIDIADVWLIDDDIPFRYNFPTLIKSHDKPKTPPCSFTFKGISSAEFGSAEMLPLCLKHEEKTDFINFVSGSPLVRETSIMRSKVITITLGLKDISPENIDKINSWLIGTGKLILSNDPDRYYIATCNNALTGQRILTLGKLPVQFNVLPYKYDNEEDDSFELVDLQDELLHKTASILYQGNAPSEPVYKITATGNVQIYNVQSGNTFEIQGLTEYCIIDIKAKKVTDENDNVILDHTYGDIFDLMLIPGDNYFFLSGSITEFEVKRKTRWY